MITVCTRRTIKPKKRVKELSRQHRQEFLADQSSPPPGPLLSSAKVAEKVCISRKTGVGMLDRGELRATRFGKQLRIGETDLDLGT